MAGKKPGVVAQYISDLCRIRGQHLDRDQEFAAMELRATWRRWRRLWLQANRDGLTQEQWDFVAVAVARIKRLAAELGVSAEAAANNHEPAVKLSTPVGDMWVTNRYVDRTKGDGQDQSSADCPDQGVLFEA